jgi:hypothetical protein
MNVARKKSGVKEQNQSKNGASGTTESCNWSEKSLLRKIGGSNFFQMNLNYLDTSSTLTFTRKLKPTKTTTSATSSLKDQEVEP